MVKPRSLKQHRMNGVYVSAGADSYTILAGTLSFYVGVLLTLEQYRTWSHV